MPRWILVIFAVAVMLSGIATAGTVGRNDVCIYEHVNYVGHRVCFNLEPGMRHKLVPTLGSMNDRASSVQVGEGVNVIIFQHAHFAGERNRHDVSVRNLVSPEHRVGRPVNFNDLVSSMIIVPRHKPLSGVTLGEGVETFRKMSVFYPLPERLIDYVARYPNLDWMSMNDKAIEVGLEGEVVVTLYEHANFEGRWIRLPTVGTKKQGYFDLNPYQFSGIVSSLEVRALTRR
jgi:hypothetical protein